MHLDYYTSAHEKEGHAWTACQSQEEGENLESVVKALHLSSARLATDVHRAQPV